MHNKKRIILIAISLLLLTSACSSGIYKKGVKYDSYPEKDIPIYDDAIVYEYEGDDEESEISYGTADDIDDIVDFYTDFQEDEADKLFLIGQEIDDDEYELKGIYEMLLFEIKAEEADRDTAKYYESIVNISVEEIDKDKKSDLMAKYAISDPTPTAPPEGAVEEQPAPEATQEPQQQMTAEEAYVIGSDYLYSTNGMEYDADKAMDHLKIAAAEDHAEATCLIGAMTQFGFAVEQDYDVAIDLYERAIELGSASAMSRMGRLYYGGDHVVINFEKAQQYFNSAINTDPTLAEPNYFLGLMWENGEGFTADYTKAAEYYTTGANLGHEQCMIAMGNLHYEGMGVNLDYVESAKYYQMAADLDNGYALYSLGWMYDHGQGFREDNRVAFSYYQKGAELGDADSQFRVGLFYENAIAVERDMEAAIYWYTQGAINGDEEAVDAVVRLVPREQWPPEIPRT